MSSFSKIKIGDILTLQRGFDITKKGQSEGVYPVVSSSGINSYHNEYKTKGPGVVIGRKGTLGTAFFIESDFWPHDTSLWVKDFKGNDPKFIYYFLKALPLQKLDSGSANPTLNRNTVHKVDSLAPDLDDQKRIASVLSALDAKIELNNAINAELEGMAKLLYDYWFVQFYFPLTAAQAASLSRPELAGHPYKSSGGPMVQNPTLNRPIPAGWEVSTIGETFTTNLGGTPSKIVQEYWSPAEVCWLSSGEKDDLFVLSSAEHISELGLKNSAAKLLPKGSVILSIVRHLRASILGIPAATNQSVVGIQETDNIKACFIYPYLVREIPRLMTLRTGAQQPHINKGVLDESPIVIPDSGVLLHYTQVSTPLFEQMENHQKQNQELTALRDWLLPMLMNGQVTVG